MIFREELLARTLEELERTRAYRVFAAFVRMGETRRWLIASVPISEVDFASALVDLDYRQGELLPETIDDVAPKTQKRLRAIFEFVNVQLRKKGAKGMLYGIRKSIAASPCRGGATRRDAASTLFLPVPPVCEELKKVSPTRLDAYRRCPFTFYLNRKDVLGDKRLDDTATKLAPWELGNVVHAALESWGASDLKDSTDVAAIAAFLSADVDSRFADRFGRSVPSAVAPQAGDAKRRLAVFAERQAAHRAGGWKVAAIERRMEMTLGRTLVYGKCDRIDFNERTGAWLVIDYKCWDSAERLSRTHFESFQLPLYREMIIAGEDPLFAGAKEANVTCGYWVLPPADAASRTDGEGEFLFQWSHPDVVTSASEVISLIERGIFWPPSPAALWRRDYGDWLAPSPEATVSEAWLADQAGRLKEPAGKSRST